MTDSFTDAQTAADLRGKMHNYADNAVQYGNVDRDWVNTWLHRLGVEPVTGKATYRINVPIVGRYGKTIAANSRAEALEYFQKNVARVAAAGQITDGSCDGVYGVQFTDEVPEFFSGPQDAPQWNVDNVPDLAGLRAGIAKMLREGVAEQGWGYSYAASALANMGLEPLPSLTHRAVEVPVSGTARLVVRVFEGDDEEVAKQAASRLLASAQSVTVTPEEAGEPVVSSPAGSDDMSASLIEDDDPEY